MANDIWEIMPEESADRRVATRSQVPARQAPLYTPEQAPRLGGAQPVPRLAAPSSGPLSSAANLTGRVLNGAATLARATPAGRLVTGAGLLLGGAAALSQTRDSGPQDSQGDSRMNSLDSQKDMIPTDANPNPVQQTPRQLANAGAVEGFMPETFRVDRADVQQAPLIGRPSPVSSGASGDRDRGGMMGVANVATVPSIASSGASGDWKTAENPAFPAPIQPAQPVPSIAARPQKTLAQSPVQTPQEPAYNPFNEGTVQIIRPGGNVTMAVQNDFGMTEMGMADFERYRSAFEKNPQALPRMRMSEEGPVFDGSNLPANVIAGGNDMMESIINTERANRASGLDQKTLGELAVKTLENQGNMDVANLQARTQRMQNEASKIPAGMQRSPDGVGFQPIPGSEADQKRKERLSSAQGTLAANDTTLATIDRLLTSPGREGATGTWNFNRFIPGTDSADFAAELETLKAQTFLPMVEQMRGLGALTDAEGKKLSAAVGALEPTMSEKGFVDSLTRIRESMAAGRGRLLASNPELARQQGQPAAQTPGAPSGNRSKPAGEQQAPTRKTVGGKTFENDGQGWYEVTR